MDPYSRKRKIIEDHTKDQEIERISKLAYNYKNDFMFHYHMCQNNTRYLAYLHKKIIEVVPEDIRNQLAEITSPQFHRMAVANRKLKEFHTKCEKK